jgi:hypothetical protein
VDLLIKNALSYYSIEHPVHQFAFKLSNFATLLINEEFERLSNLFDDEFIKEINEKVRSSKKKDDLEMDDLDSKRTRSRAKFIEVKHIYFYYID